MPELPEVEVVRLGLEAHVVGRTITRVDVLEPRSLRRHVPGPADFATRLTGRRVEAARRRGKYLWLPLDDGDAVLAHLGMSGQMLIAGSSAAQGPAPLPGSSAAQGPAPLPGSSAAQGPAPLPGSSAAQDPAPLPASPRHLRIEMQLDDGARLQFADQRIFGGLLLSEEGAELPPEIAHIARDPLDPLFDPELFRTRLKRRETGIKRALLDQGLISGVGNIYADESLWRSRLHYARNTRTLRRPEVDSLLQDVSAVMLEALAQGGTSFDRLYVNVNGQSGYFDRSLAVYGQEGEPCPRCGTPVRRDAFMNRSAYTCPRCQPRPRAGKW